MNTMTDHNLAQATLLIAALRAQLADMIPKLTRAERETTHGHNSRARALRRDAMVLRGDVGQAQFLIAQLQQRFPGADTDTGASEALQLHHDVPVRGGSGAPAVVG